jgi:hypothetical protein
VGVHKPLSYLPSASSPHTPHYTISKCIRYNQMAYLFLSRRGNMSHVMSSPADLEDNKQKEIGFFHGASFGSSRAIPDCSIQARHVPLLRERPTQSTTEHRTMRLLKERRKICMEWSSAVLLRHENMEADNTPDPESGSTYSVRAPSPGLYISPLSFVSSYSLHFISVILPKVQGGRSYVFLLLLLRNSPCQQHGQATGTRLCCQK